MTDPKEKLVGAGFIVFFFASFLVLIHLWKRIMDVTKSPHLYFIFRDNNLAERQAPDTILSESSESRIRPPSTGLGTMQTAGLAAAGAAPACRNF